MPAPASDSPGAANNFLEAQKSSVPFEDRLKDRVIKDCFLKALQSFSGTRNTDLFELFFRICARRGVAKISQPHRKRIVASLVKDGRVEHIQNNGNKHDPLKYRLASPAAASSAAAAASVANPPVPTGKMAEVHGVDRLI